jgi:hypothetical protein
MSVSIATGGMFQECCGSQISTGGAPSAPALAEKYELDPFSVKIIKVYFEDVKKQYKLPKISIKEVRFDDF